PAPGAVVASVVWGVAAIIRGVRGTVVTSVERVVASVVRGVAAVVREAVIALGRTERGVAVTPHAAPRRDAVVVRQVVVRPVAVPVGRPEESVRPMPVRQVVVRPVAVAGVSLARLVGLRRAGGREAQPGDPKDGGQYEGSHGCSSSR